MKSRYIENFELQALKKVMKDDAWLPFEVALLSGMRIGDVLKVRISDIDIQNRRIDYVSEKCAKRGCCFVPKETIKRLQANTGRGGFCFPSERSSSGHLTRQAAWKRLKRAAHECGIDGDGISPHALRKVFAVELYKEKGIEAVREALQHERADTTQLYALSDFITGANANRPLLRGDLQLITNMVLQQIRSIKNGY